MDLQMRYKSKKLRIYFYLAVDRDGLRAGGWQCYGAQMLW